MNIGPLPSFLLRISEHSKSIIPHRSSLTTMPAFRNVPTTHRNSDRVPTQPSDNYDRDLTRYPVHNSHHESATVAAQSTSPHVHGSHTLSYEYYSTHIDVHPHADVHAPSTCHSSTHRRHGRRREPGYIPRPRNSFIVFRSWWLDNHNASGEGQQNELSKQAASQWRSMTEAEKQPFKDIALQEQQLHKINHPHYQYAPGPRSTTSRTKLTKAVPRKPSSTSSAMGTNVHLPVQSVNISASSSVSSSVSPTPIYLPRVSHATAQIAIQRLEQIAMLSSPSPPARHASPYPEEHSFTYESGSLASTPEFVPTENIPPLYLEPLFVTDTPPSLETETFEFTLSELNGSNQYPFVDETAFAADWQQLAYTSSDLLYPESEPAQAPLALLGEQQVLFDSNLDHWFPML